MSEPITKTDKGLAELIRDLRPFTTKTLGSLRVSIDDCRSIVALADAYDALHRSLYVEQNPCFACGAKETQPCRRHPDKACGRESEGKSRDALPA